MKRVLTLFVVLGLAAGSVAQANELGNPGFEATDGPNDSSIWSEFAGNGISQNITVMPRSGAAHQELFVDGANGFAGVFQALTTPIGPGAIVTFTGYHKSLIQPFGATRELKIEWTGSPQLRVDSLGPIGSGYEQFLLQGIAPPGTTGATITYAVSTFGAGQNTAHMYLDNFEVTVIPEPTSIALVGLAAIGLLVIHRRK